MKIIHFTAALLATCFASQLNAHTLLSESLASAIDVDADSDTSLLTDYNLSGRNINKTYEIMVKAEFRRKAVYSDDHSAQTFKVPDCREHEYLDISRDTTPTCAIIDHFNMARLAAIEICEAHTILRTQLNRSSGLIPLFLGPDSFINTGTAADDHHVHYHTDDGLRFRCIEPSVIE